MLEVWPLKTGMYSILYNTYMQCYSIHIVYSMHVHIDFTIQYIGLPASDCCESAFPPYNLGSFYILAISLLVFYRTEGTVKLLGPG